MTCIFSTRAHFEISSPLTRAFALIVVSLSDLNDILLVVNQKHQEEEALSPDDTSDRLNS